MSSVDCLVRKQMPGTGSLPVISKPVKNVDVVSSQVAKMTVNQSDIEETLRHSLKHNARLNERERCVSASCINKIKGEKISVEHSNDSMGSGINADDLYPLFDTNVPITKVGFQSNNPLAFELIEEAKMIKFAEDHPEIQSLHLYGFSHLSESAMVKILASLPNLTSVDLEGNLLNERILTQILANPKISKIKKDHEA